MYGSGRVCTVPAVYVRFRPCMYGSGRVYKCGVAGLPWSGCQFRGSAVRVRIWLDIHPSCLRRGLVVHVRSRLSMYGSGRACTVPAVCVPFRPCLYGPGSLCTAPAVYVRFRPCTYGSGRVCTAPAVYVRFRPCMYGSGRVYRFGVTWLPWPG